MMLMGHLLIEITLKAILTISGDQCDVTDFVFRENDKNLVHDVGMRRNLRRFVRQLVS
jgi:hypothetical protein